MTTKQIRLLQPVWIDQNDKRVPVDRKFWSDVRASLDKKTAAERRFRLTGGSEFYGVAGVGRSPAVPFVRVGKLRPPADWPDTIDPHGQLDELKLNLGVQLFEGGFLVPYGELGQAAWMGPLRGTLGLSSVETWFSTALELPGRGYSLKLEPVIDHSAVERLIASLGVSRLEVTVPAGAEPLPDAETDPVTRALTEAVAVGHDDLDVSMVWTHGHSHQKRAMSALKRATQKLVRSGVPSTLRATLVMSTDEGVRTEQRNLIEDVVSLKAVFHVDDMERLEVDEVLAEIMAVIHKWRSGER